jgi:hypothetical protein
MTLEDDITKIPVMCNIFDLLYFLEIFFGRQCFGMQLFRSDLLYFLEIFFGRQCFGMQLFRSVGTLIDFV